MVKEQMAQVPVSLIHELVDTVGSKGMPTDVYLAFAAFLESPSGRPSIEDMRLGTTFTARHRGATRKLFEYVGAGRIRFFGGYSSFLIDGPDGEPRIDLATIRDIQEPST